MHLFPVLANHILDHDWIKLIAVSSLALEAVNDRRGESKLSPMDITDGYKLIADPSSLLAKSMWPEDKNRCPDALLWLCQGPPQGPRWLRSLCAPGFSAALSNARAVTVYPSPSLQWSLLKKNRTKSCSFYRIYSFSLRHLQQVSQLSFQKIFIFRRSYFHTCNLYIIYHLQQHNPAFQKQRVLLLQQKFKSVPCKFRQLPYLPKHIERRFIFVKHSAFRKVWIMWGDC